MQAVLRQFMQVLFFVVVWIAAEQVVRLGGLPVPAAVIGLFVVLALLGVGALPERFVAAGASRLLGDMLLFFIPPLIAAIQYWPLLRSHGIRMLAAIVLGTLAVLVGTALVTERALRWERGRHGTAIVDGGTR
jgi:holin-like protein